MRTVWAISRNTVTHALRMRAVAFTALLVFVLFPLLLVSLKSCGKPDDKLRLVLTYALEAAGLILSILTVFLSTHLLCSEIQDKQIFCLDTKPVPRWQNLLGKWLGIMLINASLLAAMAAPTYVLIRWLESRMTPGQKVLARRDILLGRKSAKPFTPDVTAEIADEFRKRQEAGDLPEDLTAEQALDEIGIEVRRRYQTIPHESTKTWELRNPPRPESVSGDEVVTVRFKLFSSNPASIRQLTGLWRFSHSDRLVRHKARTKAAVATFQEFQIPTSVLPKEGKLYVAYTNDGPEDSPAIFRLSDGLEVLYPALSFEQNFVNGCLLILLRIAFLAVIGIACSTFLTFPMALTVCTTAWMLCALSNYMLDVASHPLLINIHEERVGEGPNWLDEVFRTYLRSLFSVVPNFSAYNPVGLLVDGREVAYSALARCMVFLVILRGGTVALLGAAVFHTRELAKLAR